MSKFLGFFAAIFFASFAASGQRLQIGLSATLNHTLFDKGESNYDDSFFETENRTGFGLGLPVYWKWNNDWGLRSGVGFQTQSYGFEQNRFEFPNVPEGSGSFSFFINYFNTEVPLVLCYSPSAADHKFRLEFQLGSILSFRNPTSINADGQPFSYTGSDTANYNFSISENFEKYFSPDLYVAVSLFTSKANLRRHQLTLSYQHSFVSSTLYDYSTFIENSTTNRLYTAEVAPRLSLVGLTYSFYPQWGNVVKGKG